MFDFLYTYLARKNNTVKEIAVGAKEEIKNCKFEVKYVWYIKESKKKYTIRITNPFM